VVQEASRQAGEWQRAGLPLDHVAVNISPRQFRKAGLVDFVRGCLAAAGIPASMLELEITEGMFVDRVQAADEVLGELAALGVGIALDDFGTGFSSMAYLTRFPVHTIKIDRVFVQGLGGGRDAEAIVTAVIAMSKALGKRVVAEGVETAEQLAILRRLGCERIQGFHFSGALPAAAFEQFVLSGSGRALASATPRGAAR
jgi:EAL domain-containing protein (putative c-di-GMP-specific phosphodiesterase class I)